MLATIGESFTEHALDRAAFEMRCPKDQLQIKALGSDLDDVAEAGKQVGVSGCGKRLVYVKTPSGWILNSQSQ